MVSDTREVFSTESFRAQPALAAAVAELLVRGEVGDTPQAIVSGTLPLVLQTSGAQWVAVASLEEGKLRLVADFGASRTLPHALVADALDRGEAMEREGWTAVPLGRREASNEVLVAFTGATARGRAALDKFVALAAGLGASLESARTRERQ